MVADVLTESRSRLKHHNPQSADEIRGLDAPIIAFSDGFRAEEAALRTFLFENMYRHFKVNRMMGQARRVVKELFELFIDDPSLLATDVYVGCDGPNTAKTARIICDYIAAMTDRFAIEEHKKLFSVTGYL